MSTSDIKSEIGRLSLRAGTTIATPNVIWQPFGSVSVFHEFAGQVSTNYTSLPNGAFLAGGGFPPGGVAQTFNQNTLTSRVGTYGQYSLGVAGQLVNSGWLGFARVDYRNGNNIDGWTGNAGLRYQFAPDPVVAVMPTKVPVKALRPAVTMVNWTGFYVGGVLGGARAAGPISTTAASPAARAPSPGRSAPLGGLEVGYNYQFANNWVIGVEERHRRDQPAWRTHGRYRKRPRRDRRQRWLQPGLPHRRTGPTGRAPSPAVSAIPGPARCCTARPASRSKTAMASTSCVFGPTGGIPAAPSVRIEAGVAQRRRQHGPLHPASAGRSASAASSISARGWSAKTEYDYLAFGQPLGARERRHHDADRQGQCQPGEGRLQLSLHAHRGRRRVLSGKS